MGRSNETQEFTRIITPITNCRWFKCAVKAKQGKENFNAEVYFGVEPDKETFSSEEDYNKALEIYKLNVEDYNKAKEQGLKTFEYTNKSTGKLSGYKYEVDLSNHKDNGNIVQALSGRLLNFYPILDTLPEGDKKQKFVAELFDFSTREKYTVELSIAQINRNLIDSICSLTSEQLKHNIEISLIQYEYLNVPRTKTEVTVLNSEKEYGREKIEGTFEISVYNTDKKIYISTPKGSKSDNDEYTKALNAKINKQSDADKLFIEFYKRIVLNFQENVLKPSVTEMFKEMGWKTEFQDKFEDKKVKVGRKEEVINEKVREVIYLTPLNTEPQDSNQKSSDSLDDDMPF